MASISNAKEDALTAPIAPASTAPAALPASIIKNGVLDVQAFEARLLAFKSSSDVTEQTGLLIDLTDAVRKNQEAIRHYLKEYVVKKDDGGKLRRLGLTTTWCTCPVRLHATLDVGFHELQTLLLNISATSS
jgi:hypothetical protein